MKDPAFLFYSQDFIVGTLAMPFDDRGRYITLMCFQHQNGHISEETIRLLVGSFSDILKAKFIKDENGLYYNERLEIEIEKRNRFTESRHNNGSKGGRPKKEEKPSGYPYGKPKNNLIEDEDVNVIYSLYPTKCFVKNSSTGKCEKNKEQIKKHLSTKSKDELVNVINSYVSDCKEHKVYLKNFSTFLNNLPDIVEVKSKDKLCIMTSKYSGNGKEIEKPYSFYERELKNYGEENVKLIRLCS